MALPSLAKVILLSLLSIWLMGCSSTPQQTQPATTMTPTIPIVGVAPPSAEQQLQIAKGLLEAGQTSAAIAIYLDASANFAQFGQCQSVHAILAPLFTEIGSGEMSFGVMQHRANYLRALCNHPEDDISERIAMLQFTSSDASLNSQRDELLFSLSLEMLDFKSALMYYLRNPEYDVATAWDLTQNIAMNELSPTGETAVDAYLNLSKVLRQHALNPQSLGLELTLWQFNYPEHPLLQGDIIPTELLLNISQFRSDTVIAVLLPLQGRLANSAEQIKQGLLAAYMQSGHSYKLQFVNTQSVSAADLASQVLDADIVIGPLLKAEIEALAPLLRPEQILLGLNRPSDVITNSDASGTSDELSSQQHFYFGLAPEDEARQLAEHVFSSNYQQPVMIHAEDSTATRMANAFAMRWQTLNPNAQLKTLTFDSNAGMRKQITEALGVATSQSRARRLEQFHGSEIFSVTRNRRDIDAFVVFANAKQTELINPMIEASLSTFSDTITPVYASSRSYNHDLNQNSLRDLQNVFFIDMPWVLGIAEPELKESYDALFPNASTSDQRLFAMGYDAYQLLSNLNKLDTVDNLQYLGLTGELSLNDNVIKRRLPQAQIKQNAIIVLGQAELD